MFSDINPGEHIMKIIAADPGISGAICIKDDKKNIIVFDMPTLKNKKGKKIFDVAKMAEMILSHKDADLFVIEDVHCLFGNGAVSMFNFGRGKGILEGIAFASGLKVEYVSPQTWKKSFPELAPPAKVKSTKNKNLSSASKDNALLTEKEKQEKYEKDKAKRLFKAEAKSKARKLAGKLYPELANRFKTVNSDGRAEAVLLATFAENVFKE